MRPDGRSDTQLRPITITAGINPYAEGSVLCAFGQTKVICAATLEKGVPDFLRDAGKGWITAEYAMLPRATQTRTSRQEQHTGGRAKEISRLIGRSLRAAVDLHALAGNTIRLDCDLLVADGGTRCAAITGSYVALALALRKIGLKPARTVAALSMGRVQDRLLLDLCYQEDSQAQVDVTVVLAPGEEVLEIQATAEDGWFSPRELNSFLSLAIAEAGHIFKAQKQALLEAGGA